MATTELSPAEMRLLQQMWDSETTEACALGELLYLSRFTIKTQLSAIRDKLAATTTPAAVIKARKLGIIQ